MLDFFNQIFEYIGIGFSILANLLHGLLQFVSMIPSLLGFLNSMTIFIPTFLVVFFIAGFTVAIVLKVVGRK